MLRQVAWGQASAHLVTRMWPVASATILDVSLDEIPGAGSGAPTLQLSASYAFELAGERIVANRASLSDQGPLHDRRLKALYGKLQFARVTGRTLPAFYDPSAPSDAYIDRHFAWKANLMNAGFGLVLLIGGGVALMHVAQKREPVLGQRHA